MKKINLLIFSLLLATNIVYSAINTSLCAKPPYEVSSKFSQIMSQISGTNFIATKAAELTIQSQLKKQLGATKANVEIIPYSFGDFKQGKFKALSITIPYAYNNDLAFSNFQAETLCEFNHIIVEKKQVKFAQNFLMNFSSDFTNEDLQKIINSKDYLEKISDIKITLGSFSLLKITKPELVIKNGKLQIDFGIETPLLFVNSLDKISVTTKLKAENGKIQLANMNINNTKYDISLLLPIINLINPLSFESVFANNMGIAQIKNIDIINDKISLNGIIYIPQNKTIKK